MTRFIALLLVVFMLGFPLPAAKAQDGETQLNEPEAAKPILPPDENSGVVESGDTLDRLFEKLKRDPKQASANATARMIWREWAESGSKTIDLLMNWASRAMAKKQYAKAMDLLDQVIVLAPDYSEGWNRRATLHYTMNDFGRSISDIETTLALEPRHFGALSGLAAILQQIGNDEASLKTWYKVLEIYPANKQAQESVIELEEKLAGRRT